MDILVILGLGEKLKNSDFILESKMAEVTQNKNSIQLDQPNIMWTLYFTLEIKGAFNSTVYTCSTESLL